MINLMKQIVCDTCSSTIAYWEGSAESVKELMKSSGMIVEGRKHYCDTECAKKADRHEQR